MTSHKKLQFAGILSDRFGYRWTLLFALVILTGLIFIPFYANTLTMFLVGNLLMGIPWGVFQTMTTAYAAEVCPVPLRHYLTCFVNLCWIIGQFIKAGVLVGFVGRTDEWGYKIPFALQWIWPIPIAIGTYLAPESPWWYVRRGKKAEAEASLKRLARSSGFSQREADAAMARTFLSWNAVAITESYQSCSIQTRWKSRYSLVLVIRIASRASTSAAPRLYA